MNGEEDRKLDSRSAHCAENTLQRFGVVQRQAQIDGGRIQSIQTLLQIDANRIAGVQRRAMPINTCAKSAKILQSWDSFASARVGRASLPWNPSGTVCPVSNADRPRF